MTLQITPTITAEKIEQFIKAANNHRPEEFEAKSFPGSLEILAHKHGGFSWREAVDASSAKHGLIESNSAFTVAWEFGELHFSPTENGGKRWTFENEDNNGRASLAPAINVEGSKEVFAEDIEVRGDVLIHEGNTEETIEAKIQERIDSLLDTITKKQARAWTPVIADIGSELVPALLSGAQAHPRNVVTINDIPNKAIAVEVYVAIPEGGDRGRLEPFWVTEDKIFDL